MGSIIDNLTNAINTWNEKLRKIVTANGKSFSNPILDKDGKEDQNASRRVEFLFRLKDDEMINDISDILNN